MDYEEYGDAGFSVQWEYVFMLMAIIAIVGAGLYVAYNTVSSVRETVHKNFNTYRGTVANQEISKDGSIINPAAKDNPKV